MVTLNFLLAEAPQLSNWIGKILYALYQAVGSFGWTVVIFTLCLKVIVSPFDLWQKIATRRNNRAMKVMKPELERLQQAYASDQQLLQKKTMALYKQHGYSMLGACLPSIITLIIFFIVFSGFNACVKYENQKIVYDLAQTYKTEIVETGLAETGTPEEIDEIMLGAYNELSKDSKGREKWKWLWIDNVFMADTWADRVPDISTYMGTGLGKLNSTIPDTNFNLGSASNREGVYDALLGPAMDAYNKTGATKWKRFWDMKHWNGYLVLPILSLALSILSTLLMKGNQPEQPTQVGADGKPINQGNTMKIMMWMMPLMIGVFSLFYSAAFCIYMFTNSLTTVLINLIFNLVTKRKDALEDEKLKAAPYRRGN